MTHLSVDPNVSPPGTLSISQYVHLQFHPSNHQLNSQCKYHEYCCTKFPGTQIDREIPFCPYINAFICRSTRQSISHQSTPVIIGETHGKLPAQIPSKITHSLCFISYICHCSCQCIICSIHPSVR